MFWFLFGCWGLSVVDLSEAMTPTLIQKPRFFGVKISQHVIIRCVTRNPNLNYSIEWYKASKYNDAEKARVSLGPRLTIRHNPSNGTSVITLTQVTTEDSGVYFCKTDNTWGPGTELQVFRPYNRDSVIFRGRMKDGLIFAMGLLLVLWISISMLHNRTMVKRKEAIYEEPGHEHIYEGLEIENCNGDLYEDIALYAQPDIGEAPWEQQDLDVTS